MHPRDVSGIPPSAAPFFQEYDFSTLDVSQHAGLIMERILAFGNREEVRWLILAYGRQRVRYWIAQDGIRKLPWRRYHLWCTIFDIPITEKPSHIWPH